jgi:hypothetical protein
MAGLLLCVAWLGRSALSSEDLSFPESAEVERSLAVARGGQAYVDWRAWPHLFAPYGPLFYDPPGLLARLIAPKPSARLVLLLGRGQSALAVLAIGALAFAIARRAGLGRAWALLAVALNIGWLRLFVYAISFRPDAPATAFALAALAVALHGRARPASAALALAFLMASMWHKPAAWGMIATLAWWMIEGMGRRRAAIGLGLWGLAGLGAALALDAHWHGLMFLNMVDSTAFGFSPHLLIVIARRLTSPEWWIMALGTLAAWRVARRASTPAAARWLARAALVNFALATLLANKIGADIIYFLTPFPLLAVTLTLEAERFWKRLDASPSPALARAVLPSCAAALGTAFCLMSSVPFHPTWLFSWSSASRPATPPPAVERALHAGHGEILSMFPSIPLSLGSPPTLMDFYAYSALRHLGRLDPAPLRKRIEQQAFDVVVLDAVYWDGGGWWDKKHGVQVFFDGCFDLIRSRYEPVARWNRWVVLTPKNRPGNARPAIVPEFR